MNTGRNRKTIEKSGAMPHPRELYAKLLKSPGWDYKTDMEYYLSRDRALASLMYVGELRVSEAIRLRFEQFEDTPKVLFVHEVLLSKCRGKPRYRELKLPKAGERGPFTYLVLDYLERMKTREKKGSDRLFPWSLKIRKVQCGSYNWKREDKTTPLMSHKMIGTQRAWEIVKALLPDLTEHWLRVYGEKYLYRKLGKDIIAVSQIVKVDPRTAIKYLMAGEEEYPVV